MGQYYHDVTGLAAADGKPVRSTFPEEGAVLDSGSWVVSSASPAIDQAQEFIDYMARPDVQAKLARFVGTAPTVTARADRSDRRGIRRRRLGPTADPALLRPLRGSGGLGEPAMGRDDHRLTYGRSGHSPGPAPSGG
jgi:spermidine/putrescine-binding protein